SYRFHGDLESCGYDPLGRQVRGCAAGAPMLAFDGANIVRAQSWSIVPGPGLDDPLVSFFHPYSLGNEYELFYVTDGNGRHYAVGDKDGVLDLGLLPSDEDGWRTTGAASESSTFNADRLERPTAPGLSFFRNRVYDQTTGRWTQEDPIGVAGGVNLYQFNGNDPVSYTDPFGLCPPLIDCIKKLLASAFTIGDAMNAISRPESMGPAYLTVNRVSGWLADPSRSQWNRSERNAFRHVAGSCQLARYSTGNDALFTLAAHEVHFQKQNASEKADSAADNANNELGLRAGSNPMERRGCDEIGDEAVLDRTAVFTN